MSACGLHISPPLHLAGSSLESLAASLNMPSPYMTRAVLEYTTPSSASTGASSGAASPPAASAALRAALRRSSASSHCLDAMLTWHVNLRGSPGWKGLKPGRS
jgi:hypothetical protein